MRNRVAVGALVVSALALPASAGASDLVLQQNRLLDIGAEYYAETGPAQDITVRVTGHGWPALTGDTAGAQRVTVNDAQDTITKNYERTLPETPGDRLCWVDSPDQGHCNASLEEQAEYRTSRCNFPPDCTGLGPNGLLRWVGLDPTGASIRIRDVAGDTPLPYGIYADGPYPGGGTRDVELWSAERLTYTSYNDNADTVVLHDGVGSSTLSLGPGDDHARVRDGAADYVECGAGNDTVHVDASDTTAADCEKVIG